MYSLFLIIPINKLSDEELLKAYEGFDVKLLEDLDLDDDDDECDDPNCECHHHDHDHEHEHHHHHHHDEEECDDPNCECHHHDHDHEHEHHHHDHDEEECDDPNCECHHHDHEHHHHHHADEVFTSVGVETVKKYDLDSLKALLDKIANGEYGMIVRSKGIIQATTGDWYVFNLEPEEVDIEKANPIPMGKIVVIGSHIDTDAIKKLF